MKFPIILHLITIIINILIIVPSVIWIVRDLKKTKIGNKRNWIPAVIFLWIIAVPYYLYKTRGKRQVVFFFLILFGILILIHFSGWPSYLYKVTYRYHYPQKDMSTVRLVNKSSNEIISGVLKVSDQRFEIPNLKPGEEVHFNYTPRSECNYSVKVEFSSGKRLEKGVGYITGGSNYRDNLIITDEDVILGDTEMF